MRKAISPVNEVLLASRERMKGLRHMTKAKGVISEEFNMHNRQLGDYDEFSYQMGAHLWEGIIRNTRDSLFGTIFSFWDGKPMIIRGYPKIGYADEEKRFFNREVHLEEKVDGTNIGIWMNPDGTLGGKTRMSPRWDLQGWMDRIYRDLVIQSGHMRKIESICRDNYLVFGEIYGYLNPGDFIRYSIPINTKFFEICDLETLSFLDYEKKVRLLNEYNLDIVDLYWKGKLDSDEINRFKLEMTTVFKTDGMEGLVVKAFNKDTNDVEMAKIKCDEVQELAWSLSPKNPLPNAIIFRSVKKAWDAKEILADEDKILNFVIQDLKEDIEKPEIVDLYIERIKRAVTRTFGNIPFTEVWEYFMSLEREGIDITNKRVVLSKAAEDLKKTFKLNAGELYNAYCSYLSTYHQELSYLGEY